MLYYSLEELITEFSNFDNAFIPTVVLPFYHEAIIFSDGNSKQYNRPPRNLFAMERLLKNVWCCDIITKKDSSIKSRYYCSVFWRSSMADEKIVNLSEDSIDYSDDSLFNINSWGADLSFRELILMYKDDELIKPELQRKYVWSKEEASKFIDSLLLGLPVPSIFLAKVGDQKLIIDGYQRLMTVYDYVSGIFSGDGKVFKLTNSESINGRWRGKAFSELPKEEQRRIQSTTIHAIIFEQKHPANDSGMYKIFERINTSGRNLKPQEIRNCVYHGKLNSILMELNEYSNWRSLWGSTTCDSRMTDIEFILRFFALNTLIETGTELKQLSLKKELNLFMQRNVNIDDKKAKDLKILFTSVIDLIWNSLGKKAFRNLSKSAEADKKQAFSKPLHPAIFDAIAIATAQYLQNKKDGSIDCFTVDNYITLLKNKEFIDCISIRTTNTDKLIRRVELAKAVLFGM